MNPFQWFRNLGKLLKHVVGRLVTRRLVYLFVLINFDQNLINMITEEFVKTVFSATADFLNIFFHEIVVNK